MKCFSRVTLWCWLALPLAVASSSTAQETQLAFCALQNGGGLPTIAGQPPLESQYSEGLSRYLSEHLASPEFRVTQRKRAKGLPVGALFLNGELTKIGGTNGAGASYFCTLRLSRMRADKKGEIINSWSGFAQNYRWLSTNLANNPDFNREGLLGTLGEKIVAQVKACRAESSDQKMRAVAARLQQISTQTPNGSLRISVDGAQKISVTSARTGELFLVESQNGHLRTLTPNKGQMVNANVAHPVDLAALGFTSAALATKKPIALHFLVRYVPESADTPSGPTSRGLEDDKAPNPDISPLLNEEKMNELRRQIAPPADDDSAVNLSVRAPRQTESSGGMSGPPPIQVIEGTPVLPPPAIFPDGQPNGNEKWLATQWMWIWK